ncbi:MAG: ATP-binding cassette domain-containing protein, partial [Spirochaetaceae bacterium]|nr:ATP-binding cassette domain-containing protein [Spirochaetaceae bacterium]
YQNEYVCLTGSNGSGKSTLLACLNGLLTPPAACCFVFGTAGERYDCSSEAALVHIRRITGTVMQNPEDQIIFSTVEEDVAFAPENQQLAWAECARRVEDALRVTGLWDARRRETSTLSGGQRQRLAIAGALAASADILFLDEPDSMLDEQARADLNRHILELRALGKTIIRITHNPLDARGASRCVELAGGQVVYDGPPAAWLAAQSEPAIPAGTKKSFEMAGAGAGASTNALVFDAVSYRYKNAAVLAVRDTSFALPRGALVALTGRSGCGKSTVLKLAAALLLPDSGSVEILGRRSLDRRVQLRRLTLSAALAVQNPEDALFERFVADDVAFGPRNRGLKGAALVAAVRAAMDAAGLPYSQFAGRTTRSLSGGEKRRAALAGMLAMNAELYLLDEPAAGLDAENTTRVYALLAALREQGKTCVIATHSARCAASADITLTMAESGHPPPETARPRARPGTRTRKTGLEFLERSPAAFEDIPSALRRTGAPVKIILACALLTAALAGPGPVPALAVAVFTLAAGAFAGKIAPSRLLHAWRALVPLAALLVLYQFFLSAAPGASPPLFSLGRFSLTAGELLFICATAARFIAAITVLTLYTAVTSLAETLRAVRAVLAPLEKRGFPARDVTLALGITARFVPVLFASLRVIAYAQAARGARFTGCLRVWTALSLVLPLFLRALERARSLAAAIVLRGYR